MFLTAYVRKVRDLVVRRNQPIFTQDWFSQHIKNWNSWLNEWKAKPNLRFLEIGSYEGRATRWLLENILTHSTSRMYCIDTFEGSMELDKHHVVDMKKNFYHNIRPYRKKVSIFNESSQKILRNNPIIFLENSFDFIYIDGSHQACHVLEDAVLSFPLLKNGAIMLFDDYEWKFDQDPKMSPKIAIDAWLTCFEGQYETIEKGWQICIKKT